MTAQQTPAAAPPPPAAPVVVGVPGSALQPDVAGSPAALTGVPQTGQELAALRARGDELSRELVSATSRRNTLSQRLHSTIEGPDRVGIEQRMQFLDRRILQLESDIELNGQRLRSAPANVLASQSSAQTRFRGDFGPRGRGAAGPLLGFLVFVPLAFAAARLMWRRATHTQPHPPRDVETAQRLARLETAVDAIAIEMERVAEGQRFLTRILAESPALASFPADAGPQDTVGLPLGQSSHRD
jgi:hypothetical protein